MSIAFSQMSWVLMPGQTIAVSPLVTVVASSSNPAYLVLNGYDRNEYTREASGATASFSGNSNRLGLIGIGGDARGAGIVFTLVPTGRYHSPVYGHLDELSYTSSTSTGNVTDLSLFAASNSTVASSYATSAISLAQRDMVGYLDTLTIVTEAGYSRTVPSQATPFSIAATARTFVGSTWNRDGCWVLASTISAEAGASLPVQSAVNMAGAANGEWFIAYNGPAGSRGDWAASVRTGDMIGFITAAGTGHITTCVAGAGSTATLIDNITYVDRRGNVLNNANDGSPNDVIIEPAHAAAQEWQGVSPESVVIFRLDTPVVTTLMPTLDFAADGTANLASVFSAADPAGKAVTSYQAYSANTNDRFIVNGMAMTATSASTAVTASSLSQIVFDRVIPDPSDIVTVRAFNGSYWGDWTTISTTSISTEQISIYRFFDTDDGTHFFTASATEAATLKATRSDLSSEGVGLRGYDKPTTSPSSEAVFRFFDTADGTHFYTASTHERDALVGTPSSGMTYEGIAFYEHAAPQVGDSAVYRFFDSAHGTHLFTQSASERASILATRPDLVSEGIAFYAPA